MRQWIGIAALALAACGGNGDKADSGNAADAGAGSGNAVASGGGGAQMEPGLWEITTTVASIDIPSMPGGATRPLPPPTTVRTCLTPEQAARPNADFLAGTGESGGCTYESSSMSGGRIEATVQCTSEGVQMRSAMNGQFTPDSYELTQRVTTSAQGMNMEMESRTAGRRVGDCPAGG